MQQKYTDLKKDVHLIIKRLAAQILTIAKVTEISIEMQTNGPRIGEYNVMMNDYAQVSAIYIDGGNIIIYDTDEGLHNIRDEDDFDFDDGVIIAQILADYLRKITQRSCK